MKKRILFIIWSLSYGGGAENILANIVNNLDSNKYDIEVMEYLHSDKMEVVNDNVKILSPIIDATKKDFVSQIYNRVMDKLLIKICPRIIRKVYLNKSYDVEISFNYLIPTFLINDKSKKKIAWIHGSIEDLENKKWMKKKQSKSLKKVDKIVAISDVTKQSIVSEFPEYQNKIVKISNGYNFKKMNSEEVIGKFDLLYCNRFDENKNPMKFVQIIKKLNDDGIHVTAKMLGTGILLEKSKELIKEYGLEKEIECVGYKKNPYAYFKSCKIFCLTSFMEGFPTTLVEGLYFGKPFISTKVAGADELSNHGECGFVVENNEEYVEKIKLLLENDEKYKKMSLNCKKSIEKYAIENQIKEVEKCIDTL